jgi:hypothetical protein
VLKAVIAANLPNSDAETKTLYFPVGTYLVTDTLQPMKDVTGSFGLNIMGDNWRSTRIVANFNKPLINVAGDGVGGALNYRFPGFIKNISIKNESYGVSAVCISAEYVGKLVVEDVELLSNNIAFLAESELISSSFSRVSINPATYGSYVRKGMFFFGRNCTFDHCIIIGAQIALDVSGDTNTFIGLDVEYCGVIFKTGVYRTISVIGGHFESSSILMTNAITIPSDPSGSFINSFNWVDNSSGGNPCLGAFNMEGCFAILRKTNTNLIVLKASASQIKVSISGCNFDCTANLISGSFKFNEQTPLPYGIRLNITNTNEITWVKPTQDGFSNFSKINCDNKDEFLNVEIDTLKLGNSHLPVAFNGIPSKKIPIYINGVQYFLLAE